MKKSINDLELKLSQSEAAELADELTKQMKDGSIPKNDHDLIQTLIVGLGDTRGLLRRTFSKSLGLIGKASVLPLRKALTTNSNVVIRRAAAKTLKLTADPSALPDLFLAFKNDPDLVVQGSSAAAMSVFGSISVKYFIKILMSPNSTVMQCGLATWGLSFIGSKAPEALREAARSSSPEIRAAAIGALGDQIELLEDKQAIQIVLKAIDDESADVRTEAIKVLGSINKKNFIQDLLIRKLEDSNCQVRKNAALSLMKINSTKSINSLKKAKEKEKEKEVLKVLELSIKKLIN